MASTSKNPHEINQIISENIEDLIFIVNKNHICEYVNFEELRDNQTIFNYIHPNDSDRIKKFLKNTLKSGASLEESRIKSRSNSFKWFEIKSKRFIDDANQSKIFLICRDISKFKKTEKNYRESLERFNSLVDSLPEIRYWKLVQSKDSVSPFQKTREMLDLVMDNIPHFIYWKDTNLVYLGCNTNFALLNEVEESTKIIGRHDRDLIWSKNIIDYIHNIESRVMDNDQPEHNSIESLIMSDGNKKWFEINRIPLHNLKRKVVGLLVTYEDITTRKFADEKLKESEEKYRGILDNIKESYFEVDLNGTFTFFNDSFCILLGYSKEELLGINFQNLVDEENKIKIEELYNKVFKTRQPETNFQFQFRYKDGSNVTCEESVVIRYDGDGNKIGFSGLARNITEKYILEKKLKTSQEELRTLNRELEKKVAERAKNLIESEKQYRTTIDSLGDPLHVVDKDLTIILTNKNLKNWLSELNLDSDIIGKKVSKVFPFLPPKIYDEYKQVFETRESLISQETNTISNVEIMTETRKIPIISEGKVEQVITILRDISESKKMENQLKNSEKQFREMVNNLDEGFYRGVLKGPLMMHNQSFNRILGLKPHESMNGVNSSRFFANEEMREKYYLELEEKGFVRNFITQIKKRNEEMIIINLNAHLIVNPKGTQTEVEGTFMDITEKFKLEQELMESEKKLREQNIQLMKLDKVKNDFITMAAHELKTPLISISGYTDYILMKHRSQLSPEITEDLVTVQRNVRRLETLMDQLLDVMKIDEDQLKLHKELQNVSKIINNCLDELSYLINEKNLEIILDIDLEIVLNVDGERVFTIFTNLISNAIKFTPEYGWIEISTRKEDNKYFFAVKDNGIGFTEDEIKRLFKKFERIKQPILSESVNVKDSGTGLGLYITKGIINAHNGEIWAISEGLNKGSKFEFTLPL